MNPCIDGYSKLHKFKFRKRFGKTQRVEIEESAGVGA